MTDRLNGVFVTFDRDIRDDDAQCIIDAIGFIQGVASVKGNVTDFNSHAAEMRAREKWRKIFTDLLWPPAERDKRGL